MSEVVFIGTGDAFGSGGRRNTAILVRGDAGQVLIDCGPTTGTGLAELGIERNEIDAIVLSHFHGDHFGGVPFFLLASVYEDQRTRPLVIAGPTGVEARVRNLAEALSFSIDPEAFPFDLQFVEIPTGERRRVANAEVRTFEAHHPAEAIPHGVDVSLGGKRVIYSGDTGWYDKLPENARGADLFICECTSYDRPYEYHLSYVTLCQQRERFDGRMILTHLGPEMTDLRGKIDFETADDGLVVPL